MRRAAVALLASVVVATGAGCSVSANGHVAGDAPLDVYLSVPLSGPHGAEGTAVQDQARKALADAGGKAGDHPIELKVLDSTGGTGAVNPASVGANARTATEDASAIAYIGELGTASETSLPITNTAQIPQIALGPVPDGVSVDNLIQLPPGTNDPGAAAIRFLLPAIEKSASNGTARDDVRDALRSATAPPG